MLVFKATKKTDRQPKTTKNKSDLLNFTVKLMDLKYKEIKFFDSEKVKSF